MGNPGFHSGHGKGQDSRHSVWDRVSVAPATPQRQLEPPDRGGAASPSPSRMTAWLELRARRRSHCMLQVMGRARCCFPELGPLPLSTVPGAGHSLQPPHSHTHCPLFPEDGGEPSAAQPDLPWRQSHLGLPREPAGAAGAESEAPRGPPGAGQHSPGSV